MSISLVVVVFAAPSGSPPILTPSTNSTSITVSWMEINCIDRNGIITGYEAELRQVGGAIVPGMVVDRTFTASGLRPFTEYNFTVAGVNSAGNGTVNSTIIRTDEDGK